MPNISVIIADTQYLIRVGLKHLLSQQDGIEVLAEAKTEKELLNKLKYHKPNVVILDHNQEDKFTESTILKVKKISAESNILIISADENRQKIYKVLENGVNSFLTKQCDDREIIDAVTATAKGERFYCGRVLNHIMERSFGKKANLLPKH